jgi:hypothetical protein
VDKKSSGQELYGEEEVKEMRIRGRRSSVV